jgi:hypothetical protein
MNFRRWLFAPLLKQGNHIMSAIDDLKAADAKILAAVKAASETLGALKQENAALKAQLAAPPVPADDTGVATVASDLNTAADALDAARAGDGL